MPVRFAAALFDLDGTLVDTIADLADAANAMRADAGLPALPVATIARYVGKGTRQLVARSLTQEGAAATAAQLALGLERFEAHYRLMNGRKSRLFDGAQAGLEAFRHQGMRLAVVTNKGTTFTLPLLRQMNLTGFFDTVVCGDTCARRKPDPMPLLHACSLLQTPPARALFVGDSINDALAARAAGMPVLALPYGYNEGNPVQALPVDAIVGSVLEAAQWAAAQPLP